MILAAAYLLWLYQRVFFGTVTNPKNEKLHDLTPREILTFAPLVICAFWIGLYPKPFFQILETPVNQIVTNVNRDPLTAPQPTPLAAVPQPVAPQPAASQSTPRDASSNAEGLPGKLTKPVILSGASASRSAVVAESKDPYPLNSAARRQGVLPVPTPTNSAKAGN